MFSLESCRELRPRVPWTVVWVLVVVALVDISFRGVIGHAPSASALQWYESPTSLSARLRFLEREVVEGLPEPRVVILGSSRAAMGIHPVALENALELERGTAWNLGLIGGGRPFDTRYVAERFLSTRVDVERVIIAIDEFTFNRAHAHDGLFREHARLTDRWAETENAWSSSLDAVSSIRRRAPQLAQAWRARGRRDLDLQFTAAHQVRFRSWGDHRERVTTDSAEKTAARYFRNFELDRHAEMHFREAVIRIRECGAKCIFVTLPSHPVFRDVIDQRYGKEWSRVVQTLEEFCAESRVQLIRLDATNFPADHFRDAVHLTEAGSRQVTLELAKRLSVTK